jgi:hypothetical protein
MSDRKLILESLAQGLLSGACLGVGIVNIAKGDALNAAFYCSVFAFAAAVRFSR